jgi:hypothetical protein
MRVLNVNIRMIDRGDRLAFDTRFSVHLYLGEGEIPWIFHQSLQESGVRIDGVR